MGCPGGRGFLFAPVGARVKVNVKGVSPTHARRLHSGASCATRKPPLRSRLCFALAGRGTFEKRLKSTQKRWSPVIAPACGGSPAFLGPGGGRSTRYRSDTRSLKSARPCDTRRPSRARNPENTKTASVLRSCRSARHTTSKAERSNGPKRFVALDRRRVSQDRPEKKFRVSDRSEAQGVEKLPGRSEKRRGPANGGRNHGQKIF